VLDALVLPPSAPFLFIVLVFFCFDRLLCEKIVSLCEGFGGHCDPVRHNKDLARLSSARLVMHGDRGKARVGRFILEAHFPHTKTQIITYCITPSTKWRRLLAA
jgi:hypothetical protein